MVNRVVLKYVVKKGFSKCKSLKMYSVNSDEATQMMSTIRRTKIPMAKRWGLEPGSLGAARPSDVAGIVADLHFFGFLVSFITGRAWST